MKIHISGLLRIIYPEGTDKEDEHMANISRTNLVEMLNDLKNGMLKMELLVEENLEKLLDFLKASTEEKMSFPKSERLNDVKTNDLTIRSLGDGLENKAVKILSLQAPVGHDLRFVISSFRMIYDFERVSRDAYNAFVKMLDVPDSDISKLNDQYKVFETSIDNSKRLLKHFVNLYQSEENPSSDLLKKTIDESILLDNEIDDLFKASSEQVLSLVHNQGLEIESGYYLLSAIRSLERVGDHVCNLIERALYIQTGTKYEIK